MKKEFFMQVSKVNANYRVAKPGEDNCGKCGNFVPPDKCGVVTGAVASAGLCDLFKPRAEAGASQGVNSLVSSLFGNLQGGEQ